MVDCLLEQYLKVMGGVLIEGPKACGKTTTGKLFSNSELLLSSAATRDEVKQFLSYRPQIIFRAVRPV